MGKMIKVFYVGAKPVKEDNVLNRKHLRWPGFGSSCEVPEEDAAIYFRYPTVWVSEEGFAAIDKAKKADAKKIVKSSPNGEDENGGGEGGEGGNGDGGDDEPSGDDREILVKAAILQLKKDDPKDYTSQGKPRVNRIVEIVGTNVGADEINAAYLALKHDGKL